MKQSIVKIEHMSKQYNNFKALHDVSFSLEEGRIYGLIGQNGAGKTTIMRLICGFSYPTQGSVTLFGKKKESELTRERKRIGCMIEQPGLIPNMTAKETLSYHRILRGIPNTEKEEELLTLVGLGDTGGKKTKEFSLGMKQRLGIAIALLGNPELLVLDEPINGLDPIGVVEIRELIRKLCFERHITILISSHNLPELYQTATDYIIIHQGEVKQQLTLDDLEDKCKHYIKIQCHDMKKLTTILEKDLHTTNYLVMPDQTIKLMDYIDERETVAKTIFEHGMYPTNFSLEGDTLENYFISVVGGVNHD